jgi:hypothetical protein
MEIWAGWNSNGGEALADTGYKGFYEQGITENTCGYSGQSGGIFRDGLQGGQEESGILADSDVLNDDNSGHGTSPVFRERSPEAEIPGSDPDADRQRRQEFIDKITAWAKDPDSPSCRNGIGNFWAVEPNVGRVANGIPSRVDQLKCLGNAVVPQIPQLICEGLKDDFYDGRPEDYGEAWHDANNQ